MGVMNLTCPTCSTVLKPKNAIPAGKVVKCPNCQDLFRAPADHTGDKDRPAKRKPRDQDDEVCRTATDGNSRAPLILALTGGGGLLLILIVTGFVWPGFLRPSAAASADNKTPVAANDAPKSPPSPVQPQKPAKLTPEQVLAAWKYAGAEIQDSFDPDKIGEPDFEFDSRGERGPKENVPRFRFDQAQVAFNDRQPAMLTGLPQPERGFGLLLDGDDVTDANMKALGSMKTLLILGLHGPNVTDLRMRELSRLESLQWLDLERTKVTDGGLEELYSLKSLRHLNLSGTKITGAGLKELSGMQSLRMLDLAATEVAGGMKHVAGLKSLLTLDLNFSKMKDAGLKELSASKSIQVLHLWGTPVTGVGLKDLANLKSLRYLNVRGTLVTRDGVMEFINARPDVTINHIAF